MLWLLRIDIFHGDEDCDTGVYQIQKIRWSSTHKDDNEMTFLCADYTKHKKGLPNKMSYRQYFILNTI